MAIDPRREELIKQAAEKLKILIERDIKPRDIVTEEAIDDAFALDMAMGGSTNTVLHTQHSRKRLIRLRYEPY